MTPIDKRRPKRFKNPEGELSPDRSWHGFFHEVWGYLRAMIWGKKQSAETRQAIKDIEAEADTPRKIIAKLNRMSDKETITWLGHSSFLIHIEETRILVDPFLSDYAADRPPFGSKRVVRPALRARHLPPIDIILITHNHYDHCDKRTLKKIPNKELITVVVPTGMKKTIESYGYRRVIEIGWHDSVRIKKIEVTAVPALHHSRRGLFDYNKSLWCGFVIKTKDYSLYYAGDTGYGKIFTTIGQMYGPFEYAFVPIGGYQPRWRLRAVHTTPEEAVQIGYDVGAYRLIGMHWGALDLTDEPFHEPPERFLAAGVASPHYKPDHVAVLKLGQTIRMYNS